MEERILKLLQQLQSIDIYESQNKELLMIYKDLKNRLILAKEYQKNNKDKMIAKSKFNTKEMEKLNKKINLSLGNTNINMKNIEENEQLIRNVRDFRNNNDDIDIQISGSFINIDDNYNQSEQNNEQINNPPDQLDKDEMIKAPLNKDEQKI